ncbi:MAG: NGG1p interacting factor NIF3 [Candidatus Gracilibacteria bacterium]|nr:NGG1p interacting factor NIF3 [Candidatus Gracilibacteria bacterium]
MAVTLGDIYKKAVEIGMKNDPRTKEDLAAYMKEKKEKLKKMNEAQKKLHADWGWNPYDDTRVIYGDLKRQVEVVYVGIDVETQELALISALNGKREREGKKPIDLALAHHPESHALEGLAGVMEDIQVATMKEAGIPPNLTSGSLKDRIGDVTKSVHSDNLHRAKSAAQLLDIPFFCAHTIADNVAYQVVSKIVQKLKPRKVKDVVEALGKIPHFKKAAEEYSEPISVQTGSLDSWAGKVFVEGYTGGTDGSAVILKYLSRNAQVGTTIAMHKSKAHRDEANKHHLNSIITNHMASDALGMQPLVDWLRSKKIEVVIGCGMIDAKMP